MKRKSKCIQCGRPDDEVGTISRRGLCRFCGMDNKIEFDRQMREKSGPAYNQWLKRMTHGRNMWLASLQANSDDPPDDVA